MGVPTVTATRILKGQLEGHLGPETLLAMDHFPYMALSKVSTKPHLGQERRLEEEEPRRTGAQVWCNQDSVDMSQEAGTHVYQ